MSTSPEMDERILAHMRLRHARRPKGASSAYDFVGHILVSALAEAETDKRAENLFRLLHDWEEHEKASAFAKMLCGEFDLVQLLVDRDNSTESAA